MINAWLVSRRREPAPPAAVDRAAGTTGIVTYAPAVRTNLASPSTAVLSCTRSAPGGRDRRREHNGDSTRCMEGRAGGRVLHGPSACYEPDLKMSCKQV